MTDPRWLTAPRHPWREIGLLGLLLLGMSSLLVGVLWFGTTVLTAARGYVAGEGYAIKAQKSAVSHLVRYVETGEGIHWREYELSMEVALAARRVRRALDEEPPDRGEASRQLLVGRNHPEDHDEIIWLYRMGRWVPEMDQAVVYWTQADAEFRVIDRMAHEIRAAVEAGEPGSDLRSRLDPVYESHRRLTEIGNEFSVIFGRASRRIRHQLNLFAMVVAGLMLVPAIVVAVRLVLRLRRSDEIFRRMIDYGHDLIVFRGPDGTVLYVNPAAERILGHAPRDVIGTPLVRWLTPRDQAHAAELLQSLVAVGERGEPVSMEVSHADGGIRSLEVKGRLLRGFDPAGVIVLAARDVTERRALERQMVEMQRLESLGRLAGGVAHEFNNLLTTIAMSAGLVRRKMSSHGLPARDLDLVIQATDHAAGLTRRLLTFSNQQAVSKQPVSLRRLVVESEAIFRCLLSRETRLTVDGGPQDVWVEGDAAQLEQVLVNLVVNAADALGDREGALDIVLSADGAEEDGWARLRVADDGAGMAEETLERIFEPFYTTKATEGTGLGLAICDGILKDHGGRIEVSSSVGEGTEFRVFLPVIEAPAAVRSPAVRPLATGSGQRLLLVEDEAPVRELARRVLEVAGYRVTEAADGQEGLERWRAEEDRIELVVTDVVMPRLGGAEMVEQIREEAPGTAVLFLSGYHDGAMAGWGQMRPGTGYLDKPFLPDALIQAVRELAAVDGPGAADSSQASTHPDDRVP